MASSAWGPARVLSSGYVQPQPGLLDALFPPTKASASEPTEGHSSPRSTRFFSGLLRRRRRSGRAQTLDDDALRTPSQAEALDDDAASRGVEFVADALPTYADVQRSSSRESLAACGTSSCDAGELPQWPGGPQQLIVRDD